MEKQREKIGKRESEVCRPESGYVKIPLLLRKARKMKIDYQEDCCN
jgi:hypothetical protein